MVSVGGSARKLQLNVFPCRASGVKKSAGFLNEYQIETVCTLSCRSRHELFYQIEFFPSKDSTHVRGRDRPDTMLKCSCGFDATGEAMITTCGSFSSVRLSKLKINAGRLLWQFRNDPL